MLARRLQRIREQIDTFVRADAPGAESAEQSIKYRLHERLQQGALKTTRARLHEVALRERAKLEVEEELARRCEGIIILLLVSVNYVTAVEHIPRQRNTTSAAVATHSMQRCSPASLDWAFVLPLTKSSRSRLTGAYPLCRVRIPMSRRTASRLQISRTLTAFSQHLRSRRTMTVRLTSRCRKTLCGLSMHTCWNSAQSA
jgi:hypothetical protein